MLSFDLFPERIPHNNILIERHIFCISYKWYGQKKIYTISITDDAKRFAKDIHDDRYVLEKFHKVMEKADAHVAHYGNKFDMKMLNGRLAINNLPPLPKIISLDTQVIARKYFKFNCNRLDYLAQLLGYEGKLANPSNLWNKCFEGDEKALDHMSKYNRKDIKILNFVFERLSPFIKNNQLNMGMFLKGARCPSPTCGSTNIEWRGYNYTRTNKFRRFICKECCGWSDERKALRDHSPDIK